MGLPVAMGRLRAVIPIGLLKQPVRKTLVRKP